jgi:Fic family protein
MNYLTYILIGVVGFALGRQSKQSLLPTSPDEPYFAKATKDKMAEIRSEAREALAERTEGRKEKILEFMRREKEHREELKECNLETGSNQLKADGQRPNPAEQSKVTCADIEQLLGVSDSTASKYLNALEDEGKIKQVGTSGRGVYYTLLNSK